MPNNTPVELEIDITSGYHSSSSKLGMTIMRRWAAAPERVPEHPLLTAEGLVIQVVQIREAFDVFAKRYANYRRAGANDPLSCDADRVFSVWLTLRTLGRDLYRMIFALNVPEHPLRDVADDIRTNLSQGARVKFDCNVVPIPWGLLYDARVPHIRQPTEDPLTAVRELQSHFWGLQYCIENVPDYPRTIEIDRPVVLENEEYTRLTVTVNQSADQKYSTSQLSYFNSLTSRHGFTEHAISELGAREIRLNLSKDSLIDSLIARREPQHLYYFYCHHRSGDGAFKFRGFRVYSESALIVDGDESESSPSKVLTARELARIEEIEWFHDSAPVVFLNACESAHSWAGLTTGFLPYFTKQLCVMAFIGTEASIPASIADDVGRHFVDAFLRGDPLGVILLRMRQRLAYAHLNPAGLYYSLFGSRDVRLRHNLLSEVANVSSSGDQRLAPRNG